MVPVAASGLADRMRPHLLVAGCATGAAACTLVIALVADGPAAAVPLRFATGAFHQRHPQRRGSRVAPLAPAPSSST